MSQPIFSEVNANDIIHLDDLRRPQPNVHIFDHKIKSTQGKGSIRFLKLDLGFRIVEVEANFRSNVQINLYSNCDRYVYFLYCTEGNVYQKFENQTKLSMIEELSPSIVGSPKDDQGSLYVKANKPVKLNIICIDKSIFFREYVSSLNFQKQAPTKNDELLKSLNDLSEHLYGCAKNLQFAELLRAIKPFEISDEFIELLDVKSKYLKVLSLYLDQFYKEMYVKKETSSLTTKELQQIRKISEFIIDNLDVQHTIKDLCKQSGLSPSKLQEGFKSMHGTTVSDFIRTKRLEKSEELFATTDLNVSEVVYRIGITSRSYFCKIFKEKYGRSPSVYRKLKRNTKAKETTLI